jgi:hypothetical protein
MKTLTAIAIASVLFAGATTASAQNAPPPTTKVSPSPSSINKSRPLRRLASTLACPALARLVVASDTLSGWHNGN